MASATLSWYPSTDPTTLRYHIWAGATSHVYDASGSPKDVGNVTQPPHLKSFVSLMWTAKM
jgi:hypothetical protein